MSIVLNGTTGITSTGITETSDGKVGIGTGSPAANLHISSTGTPTLRIQDADGSDYYAQISQATGNTIFDARYGASNGAFIFRGLGGGVPVERMRILPSGGITFNGDTAAANALDDYEEGTWTPAYSFTGGGTVTHGSPREGVYTKIGKMVLASFNIRSTGVSGVSGNLELSGLPFTVQSTGSGGRTGGSQGFTRDWGADMPNFRIYSYAGQAKLLFYYNAMNGGTQQVGTAQFSTGSDNNVAEWSIVYFTE